MGRAFLGVFLCAVLAGCTNAFSRSIVVPTEAAPVEADESAITPSDVTSASAWGPSTSGGATLQQQRVPQANLPSAQTMPNARTMPNGWTYYSKPVKATLSDAEIEACRKRWCLAHARRKSNKLTVGVWAAMVAYGFAFFDYGSSNYQVKSDGWFEEDNKDGGADKWGHAVSTHIQTAIFSAINRSWGIPRKEAALRGAITAWSIQFIMEIGDGFSDQFGSSWTDLVANTAGAAFGYFHETDPRFARLFDLRWEYWPSDQVTKEGDYELSTDIEGSSYVIAVNLGAIYSRQSNFFDYFDFQCGYAARHYKDTSSDPERRPFIGLGINLSNVCKRLRLPVLSKFFEYYQPPGISLRWDTDLNK